MFPVLCSSCFMLARNTGPSSTLLISSVGRPTSTAGTCGAGAGVVRPNSAVYPDGEAGGPASAGPSESLTADWYDCEDGILCLIVGTASSFC